MLALPGLARSDRQCQRSGWLAGVLPQLGQQGVATGFLISTELRLSLFASYYNTLLHRQPDLPGLFGWALSSLDASNVRLDFEISPEFYGNG